jgi:hypothetical protein
MLIYLLRRMALMLPTLFGITVVVFTGLAERHQVTLSDGFRRRSPSRRMKTSPRRPTAR